MMSLNRGLRTGPSRGSGGLPPWLVFLIAVALVFGGFYLVRGVQDFMRTGGLGVSEATARAQMISTATAVRVTRMATGGFTPLPTGTPIPECIDFRVSVSNAIVREQPSFNAPIVTSFNSGTEVCVLGRAEQNAEWYIIDADRTTRRRETAYMHESVIEAVNPTATPTRTPTPSRTPTPLPSVTPVPNLPTPVPSLTPTPVLDSRATLPGLSAPESGRLPTMTPAHLLERPTGSVEVREVEGDIPPSP
ncbi:MAG: SH3 domain-containing protein [Anaerolinea sp.]|nr:SH3 domain-containing protein [Anaerolinea sp.]